MRDALTKVRAERKLALAIAGVFIVLAAAVCWIGGLVQPTLPITSPPVETAE